MIRSSKVQPSGYKEVGLWVVECRILNRAREVSCGVVVMVRIGAWELVVVVQRKLINHSTRVVLFDVDVGIGTSDRILMFGEVGRNRQSDRE